MIVLDGLRFLKRLYCAQNWHNLTKLAKQGCGGRIVATSAVSAIVRQLSFGIWRHRTIIFGCRGSPFRMWGVGVPVSASPTDLRGCTRSWWASR